MFFNILYQNENFMNIQYRFFNWSYIIIYNLFFQTNKIVDKNTLVNGINKLSVDDCDPNNDEEENDCKQPGIYLPYSIFIIY